MGKQFPLERVPEIEAAPEDFVLIERIPITRGGTEFPVTLGPVVGDEVPLVLLDTETTGLSASTSHIIELGLVRVQVSPSTGQVTTVECVESHYQDPGYPIPEEITEITGITDADVKGHHIDPEMLEKWFAGDPIVVAHNASFDRAFMDRAFPQFSNNARWACSSKGVAWRKLGFEGTKLEYLLYKCGAFYEGHRASIDCLAMAWLFHCRPEAVKNLLAGEKRLEYAIKAIGSPFDVKDALKERGYRWDADRKYWHTVVAESDLGVEQAFLAALYHRGDERADIKELTSRTRFKEQ